MNTHIESYLEYYKLLKNPGYAVMISGVWGSGKTWFIKKYLSSCSGFEQKHLYVSLYGLSKVDEIEYELFKQLHPVLASKPIALVSSILKGAIKTVIKVDINGENSTTLNAQIPDIKIPDYLTNTNGFILVFDDIERCETPINNIFGYINHFVENNDYNAILVANETEIKDQENYNITKEKLIGVTFEVESDIHNAIVSFISELDDIGTRNFLEKNIEIIKSIHENSEYKNLRHIKQSLSDFQRLFLSLTDEYKKNPDLIKHLLKIYLSLSIELKSGKVKNKQILELSGNIFTLREEGSTYSILKSKYPEVPFFDLIFESNDWLNILTKGILDKTLINKEITSSRYYRDQSTPTWIRLWSYYELNDIDLNNLVDSITQELKQCSIRDIGVVKHICGILIELKNHSLISLGKKEIFSYCKMNVDNIYLTGAIEVTDWNPENISDAYGNRTFFSQDDATFKKLCSHIKKQHLLNFEKNITKLIQPLLYSISHDINELITDLLHSNHVKSKYYDKPILKYINPDDFVSNYLLASGYNQQTIKSIFDERYKHDLFNNALIKEKEWLQSLKSALTKKLKPKSIQSIRIKHLISTIDIAIDKLSSKNIKSS